MGSDQINLLICQYLCSINRCFQGLERTFRGRNGHRKKLSKISFCDNDA
jgi:hypothetical protein